MLLLISLFGFFSAVALMEPSIGDAIFLLALVIYFFSGRIMRLNINIVIPMAGYLLINLFSISFQDNVGFGFYSFFIRVYLCLVVYLVAVLYSSFSEKQRKYFLMAFVFGGLANAAVIFLALITRIPALDFVYMTEGRLRYKGLFAHPNVMAPHLVLCASIAAVVIKDWILRISSIFVICISIFLSFSRAGWFAFFFVPSAYFFIRAYSGCLKISAGNALICVMIGVSLIMLALGLTNFTDFGRDLELFNQRASFQDYDSDRFEGQIYALNLFFDQPWGYGPGSTVAERGSLMPVNDPHNVYIKIATETGFFGFLAFLFLLVYSCITAFKLSKRGSILGAVLLSNLLYLCVVGMIVDIAHWRVLFILLGLIAGLAKVHSGEQRKNASFGRFHFGKDRI